MLCTNIFFRKNYPVKTGKYHRGLDVLEEYAGEKLGFYQLL
jgi:hypothetical protein